MQCLHASEFMSLRLDGLLDEPDERRLKAHLVDCSACQNQWARLSEVEALFVDAPMPIPPPALQRNIMAAVQRKSRLVEMRRRSALLAVGVILAVVAFALPVMLVTISVAADPLVVQQAVGNLVRVAGMMRSLGGALALVLRALVGGMNWVLLPGCLALVVGMLLVWWYLLHMPKARV
jgi:predicted anti-sigma-YlaC factor YlaD